MTINPEPRAPSDTAVMRAKCATWKAANPGDPRLLLGWDYRLDEPILCEQTIVATYEYPLPPTAPRSDEK